MPPKPTAPPKSPKNPASAPVPQADHGPPLAPPANLAEAKLRVMVAVPYIRKRGALGSYNFVRDVDVIAILRPAMIENAIVLCGPVELKNRTVDTLATPGGKSMNRTTCEYKYQLKFAPTGETEDIWVIGEGADNLDKGSNKSMSAGRKYALLLGFSITTGDDPDQFDSEGNHTGAGDDDPPARTRQSPPQQPAAAKKEDSHAKPVTKDPSLPENGTELSKRLRDYDSKLAQQNKCKVGELISTVTQSGVKAGYSANMDEWTGPAIEFAVNEVRKFTEGVNKPAATQLTQPTPASPPAPLSQPTTPVGTMNSAADILNPPAAPGPKTPEQTAAAKDRFNKRIAGMNATQKVENIEAFRSKYTADSEMTEEQVGLLEACYWANKKRLAIKGQPA